MKNDPKLAEALKTFNEDLQKDPVLKGKISTKITIRKKSNHIQKAIKVFNDKLEANPKTKEYELHSFNLKDDVHIQSMDWCYDEATGTYYQCANFL
jgi:hypothetical protein